jgi:uncharacterized protein (DUF1330 family)
VRFFFLLRKPAVRFTGERLMSGSLARGGKTVSIEGEAPKSRVVVQVWENIDKAQAGFASAAYKENRKIGDKYAKFRIFAVEGLPSN